MSSAKNVEVQDSFVEKEYMKGATRATSTTGGKPIVVGVSRDKCGIDEVDVEILVMRRALARVRSQTQEPAMLVDIDVISRSIDRMLKCMKAATVPSTSTSSTEVPAATSSTRKAPAVSETTKPPTKGTEEGATTSTPTASEPTGVPAASTDTASSSGPMTPKKKASLSSSVRLQQSPAYQERQKHNLELQREQERLATEHAAQRKSAEKAVWGTLTHVLEYAQGDFKLLLNSAEVKANRASLMDQSRLFGLTTLAGALVTQKNPLVTIRGIALPPGTPQLGEDRVLPRGIVRYLTERNLPVVPSATSKWGSCDVRAVVDHSLKPFMTNSQLGSSVTIDFGGAVVRPTAYGFASIHNILPGYFPRSWRLLGSLDGVQWTLITEHSNDYSFSGKIPSCVWSLVDKDEPVVCRALRVESAGPNSFATHELQVSSFEVYGSVMLVENYEKPKLEHASPSVLHGRNSYTPVDRIPDISTLIKKKKKG